MMAAKMFEGELWVKASDAANNASEAYFRGTQEDYPLKLVAWRVSFNDGKTWTIWETDPQLMPDQAIVQPMYVPDTTE